jgi:hypothetical protein
MFRLSRFLDSPILVTLLEEYGIEISSIWENSLLKSRADNLRIFIYWFSRNLGATTPWRNRSLSWPAHSCVTFTTCSYSVMERSVLLLSRKMPASMTTCYNLTVSHVNFIPKHACLMGYDTAPIGNRVPTFRHRVMTLPARAHCPSLVQILSKKFISKYSSISVRFV